MRNKAVQKNIFEEINRTIELKNKLTVAKNNINKVIVRGGGKQSQTLEEIAGNIEGMVKQYSKFAQGTCDLKKEIGGSGGSIKIPFNLDFNPKIIFLDGKIEHSAEIDEFCINNQNDIKYEWRGRDSGWIKVALGDSTYCTFKVSNFTYYHTFRILKWYAIG